MNILGCKINWYDYDNESGTEYGPRGYFDPKEYSEYISFTGEFENPELELYEDNSFPTKWLSEDFEGDLKIEVAEHFDRIK